MNTIEVVKEKLRKYELLENKLVLAVSGGVDSMLMLAIISAIYKGKESLLKVVHFDHQVRKDSYKDYDLIQQFCGQRNIECKCIKLEFESNSNFENRARDMRKEFLLKEKEEFGAEVVLLGHNADDALETIVHKFLKGTFVKGFAGISEFSEEFFRPLIDFNKKEIYKLAKEMKVDFNEYPTNSEISYDRNFLRNNLIPNISERYLGFENHLLEKADFYRELDVFLTKYVSDLSNKISKKYLNEFLCFKVQDLLEVPNFIMYELLKQSTGGELSVSNFKEFLKFMLTAQNGKKFMCDGFMIEKSFDFLIFVPVKYALNMLVKVSEPNDNQCGAEDFYEHKIPVFMRDYLKNVSLEDLRKYSILNF
jgi:tRNA(Ile)-lysidine synthetase-like protein